MYNIFLAWNRLTSYRHGITGSKRQKSASTILILLLAISFSAPGSARQALSEAEDRTRFAALLFYAGISNAAYMGADAMQKTLDATGYELTDYGQLAGYGVRYYVATDAANMRQLVAIRGTSNVENAVVDVAFKLLPDDRTGIKLHQGFGISGRDIVEAISPHLNREYRVITTGHSLGGAAALVVAMMLDAEGYEVDKVITFGQPKVTNITGSNKYSHLDVTRVVTPKDMVPLVPPLDPMDLASLDIYWHQGTEIVLLDGNSYAELEGKDSVMRATAFLNQMMDEQNLQHHMMSTYIASLQQKQQSPKRVPLQNDFRISDLFGGGSTPKLADDGNDSTTGGSR